MTSTFKKHFIKNSRPKCNGFLLETKLSGSVRMNQTKRSFKNRSSLILSWTPKNTNLIRFCLRNCPRSKNCNVNQFRRKNFRNLLSKLRLILIISLFEGSKSTKCLLKLVRSFLFQQKIRNLWKISKKVYTSNP